MNWLSLLVFIGLLALLFFGATSFKMVAAIERLERDREQAEKDALALAVQNEEQAQLLRSLGAPLDGLGGICDLDERARRAHLN